MSDTDQAEQLYASDHLRITHFRRDTDFVVVTFDHWEAGKNGFKEFTGGSLWAKRGISQLHVGASSNNWFLATDTRDMLGALRAACSRYSRIITYGSSMAGYAALLFGGALRAHRALAISPHFSVDPAKAPFETRWASDRDGLDFTSDRLGAVGADIQDAVVIYDLHQAADFAHVRLLQQHFPTWQYVALRHGGHPAFQTLASAGRSAVAAATLFDEAAPGPALVRLHKAARVNSPTYWAMLAERNVHRPRVLLAAANRCLSMRNTPGDALYRVARGLIDSRHPMLAALLLNAAIDRSPEPPRWWHTSYATALERVRLLNEKTRAARRAAASLGVLAQGAATGTAPAQDPATQAVAVAPGGSQATDHKPHPTQARGQGGGTARKGKERAQ